MRRLAVTLLAITPLAGNAADRGATAYQVTPAHNAVVSFAASWGPQLKTAWTASLDGPASFPLVVNNAVFALVAGSPAEIVRLDAATGAVVWKVSAGSGSSQGIAYDQGRVFSVNNSGTMSAYDAGSGRLAWTLPLPGQYSFSAAPSALNGMVYVGGAGSGGTLYAVDAATGKLVWTQPVANGDASSPAVTQTGVYVSYPCQYYDFTPTTGNPVWHVNTGCDGGGGDTPVVYKNRAFIRDFTGSNSILDATTGVVVGTFAASAPPAISGRIGYFLDGATLSAVNPATSRLYWEFTGDGTIATPPLVVNGYVVAASSNGNLYVIDDKTGAAATTIKLGKPAGSPLGAGGGLLLVPLGSTLVAYASTT